MPYHLDRLLLNWLLPALLRGAVICSAGMFVSGLSGCGESRTPAQWLAESRIALKAREFDRAEFLATQVPFGSSEWTAATTLAGEAASRDGRPRDALQHYLRVAEHGQPAAEAAFGKFYAGEVYRELGQLSAAEQAYAGFLESEPQNAAGQERLAFLMGATGRLHDAASHYFAIVRSGSAQLAELAIFADLDRPFEQRPFLKQCDQNDPLVQLGLAAHDYWEGTAELSEASLRKVIHDHPQFIAAHVMLGELLVGREADCVLEWHRQLPPDAERCPNLWYVRGLLARRMRQEAVATGCFLRSCALSSVHRRSITQLGQILTAQNDPRAAHFSERARQLAELTRTLDDVLRTKTMQPGPVRAAMQLLDEMGRAWESCAWALAAQQQFPEAANWTRSILQERSPLLLEGLPQTLPELHPARGFIVTAYPPFDNVLQELERELGAPRTHSGGAMAFTAAPAGPAFNYFNAHDPATPGARQFEQTGGGVAVLDYDGDQRPDLCFPQGCRWPTGSERPDIARSSDLRDALFRNVDGESFVDVNRLAFGHMAGFGQGCAAGDFDNDGFSDLYVARVGRNLLLRNNGDGTFSDISDSAGLAPEAWTTSCSIADLNADGIPDLFDVNYLTGPDIYSRICQQHACSPKAFQGAEDALLIGRGDGTFRRVLPQEPEVDGKGLGLIVIELEPNRRPSVLIANDQVPNFLLQNTATGTGPDIRLKDDGFLSGVAFNQDGLAMASMGIAADDADGDGRIDFYVTTFKDEASLLLMQSAPGFFVDQANAGGLRGATSPFVGWGTQFLDADLDGEPDLVQVNGHVDDYRPEGGEYPMRPQCFRNLGGGRFTELRAQQAGAYFDQKHVGRGLARLDWNDDGRMDFAVSNIGERASLLANTSAGCGHFLNVRLHATTAARDAIGTVVTVTAGGRSWTKQLLAGDGYMASNERCLQFGLGSAAQVDSVRIHWPSGRVDQWQQVVADRTLELFEGRAWGLLWERVEHSVLLPAVAPAKDGP